MIRPKVSIIVPVYNVEQYLHRCVDSLINQSLSEIEIILVDDCSPDNSPHVCDELAGIDKRIKVIHKTKNEGLGMARNSGLEVARGEYVAFVDSDDYVDTSMYEKLYKEAAESKLDIIYSEFNVDHYPGYRIIPNEMSFYDNHNKNLLMLNMIGAEPSFTSDVKFQVSSCKGLYKLKLIKDSRIKFHSERDLISEDLIFNLDCLGVAERIKIVPWQLYYYCLNNQSVTHLYRPKLWENFLFFIDYLKKYESIIGLSKDFNLRIGRTLMFYLRCSIGNEKKMHASLKKIRNNIKSFINNPDVKEVLTNYPFKKLPFKHKFFFILCKYHQYSLIYMML